MDEFKSNFSRLVNITKIVDERVNIALVLLRKIRRENWWPRVLKVCFCNFDFSFKNKNGAPKNSFAHPTEDEIGELLVENDSINTQNATRTDARLYLHSHSCNKFVLF